MNWLPKLRTGLDVNVHFDSIFGFDATPELALFSVLDIKLCHGWLADPEDSETFDAIVPQIEGDQHQTLSYNALTDFLVSQQENPNNHKNDVKLLKCQQFLEKTASQLTYYGLMMLGTTLPLHSIVVLFRNNHFSVLYKRPLADAAEPHDVFELLQLVTDSGFLSDTRVVWETLSNMEGDSAFLDGHFNPRFSFEQKSGQENEAVNPKIGRIHHADADYALALALQEEEDERERESSTSRVANYSAPEPLHQQEEDATESRSGKKKSSSMCILS
jgi:hypothetical protein